MFHLLQTSFWQKLQDWDHSLFIKINSNWTNPFFDIIMPLVRNPFFWTPLYLFLALFILINFKEKGIWWCVLFLATAALTDMTGTYIFKHNIPRLRPCGDPGFMFQVRLLVDHCSTGNSFISNHAANHFGLATFFFMTMRSLLKKWAFIGFLWAVLVAYAQVYVGLHYPLDVLAGAILGLILGAFTGLVFNKRFGFVIFGNQPTLSS